MMAGCNNTVESQQYQAINDQQSIMKDYYRQHRSCQSNLSTYKLNYKVNYNPTYDSFGALSPESGIKGSYFERTSNLEISVYSGYFIADSSQTTYVGNKENVGSIDTKSSTISLWFTDFENASAHPNQKELIQRVVNKDNDIAPFIEDTRTGVAVESYNISHYFSNNINTDFRSYFSHPRTNQILPTQPTATTTLKVAAYRKSESEIVETTNEVVEDSTINNPIHFGDEYKITVYRQTTSSTTFKRLDGIGWAATKYSETVSYNLVSDYELRLLNEPRVIKQYETTAEFEYSASIQAYTGESFTFKESDKNLTKYIPTLYCYEDGEYIAQEYECNEITAEYKRLNPTFNGYVYHLDNIIIEEGKAYSFACKIDVESDTPKYETIGFSQIKKNAGGTIISAGIANHNLFKTITSTETYEFIILISGTGAKTVVAQLS